MLVNRPVKKTAYIIVSSDRGLVGGYNANIFRAARRAIEERHASKDDVKIVAIGRKGLEFFERLGYEVIESLVGVSDHPSFDEIKSIANRAVGMFTEGEYDEVYLYYSHFISAISNEVTEKKLLPLTDISSASALILRMSLSLPRKRFLKRFFRNTRKASSTEQCLMEKRANMLPV